jgi:hypothetical protein
MTSALPTSPPSWALDYVGLPYILGAGECAHRAALVWRQVFGWQIEIPAAHGNLRIAQRLIRQALASGDWVPTAAPQDGDAVVMRKGDLLCHVGVWIAGGYVLHCTRAEGMVLTRVEDLPAQGFPVARTYTRKVAQQALVA